MILLAVRILTCAHRVHLLIMRWPFRWHNLWDYMGAKCETPTFWEEVGNRKMLGLEMLWYVEVTTRRVRFGLPCWSNISRQEHCLRFESLHKQDRSCLAWMILVDQISQCKNTCLRFESLHKQDWSCRAWMILHAI